MTSSSLSRRRILTGGALLVGCVVYLIAEAFSAGAWREPGYSYVRNYVSDLGAVAGSGLHASPLAMVFNAGILIAEAMMMAALALLAPLIRVKGWRWAAIALATCHGLGSDIVAAVHSAPGTRAGTPHVHIIGAYLAIAGGNLALCAIGLGALRQRAPSWFGWPILFGAVGMGGAVALLLIKAAHVVGLFERIAIDGITFGEVWIGALLLVGRARGESFEVRRTRAEAVHERSGFVKTTWDERTTSPCA